MGAVQVFRCRLCQEAYIGEAAPTRCPYCGASTQTFLPAREWDASQYQIEIGTLSKTNLAAALQLEVENAMFYRCAMNAARQSNDEYGSAKFKALQKVESEHARIIAMALQTSVPAIDAIPCATNVKENTQEGWTREDAAIKAYAQFAEATPEHPIRLFFQSLVEIESTHLQLHADDLKQS